MTHPPLADELAARLNQVELLLTDVDWVMTDGHILFAPDGTESKSFHVHDAAGLIYWHRCGGISGFLSGRRAPMVERRAEELGVEEVHLGFLDKLPVFEQILDRRGIEASQVLYVGDDLLALPVLRTVGVSVAPADARIEVRQRVDHVSTVGGGRGVLREVVELLLRARGQWDRVVEGGGRP